MSEFPEPEPEFYVMETFALQGGGTVTEFAEGPFSEPDEAREARKRIFQAEPGRNVHCVEFRSYP